MSGPGPSLTSETGPIGKRMTAERGRTTAIIQIVVGCGWFVLGVVTSFRTPQDTFYWVQIACCAAVAAWSVIVGVAGLRARAKRIALFDAQYGASTGRQPSRS